jgi:hypothetical protein
VSSIDALLNLPVSSAMFILPASQLNYSNNIAILTTEISETNAKFTQVMVVINTILKNQANNAAEMALLSAHSGKIMSQE